MRPPARPMALIPPRPQQAIAPIHRSVVTILEEALASSCVAVALLSSRYRPFHVLHANVLLHESGLQRRQLCVGLRIIAGLAHNKESGHDFQARPDAIANRGMVAHQQQADRRRFAKGRWVPFQTRT